MTRRRDRRRRVARQHRPEIVIDNGARRWDFGVTLGGPLSGGLMDFFVDHAVLFALVCAGVAIAFGLYLTYWVLSQPAGN